MSSELIQELQDRISQNPKDYDAVEQYAIELSDIGENEEALKNFMFLKSVFPDNAKIYYNIGIILEKLKMFDDSLVAYEQANKLEPDNTDIMYNLANVYIKAEEYEAAEKLLLKVIETDKDDQNSYFHLGEIYSRKKQYENAVKYLSKAVELDNSDTISKFYLAYAFSELGDTETAIRLYTQIINENPEYSWAYFNLAAIYISKEQEDKAVMFLEKTIQTNPRDINAIKMYIKLLSKHKKYSVAEKLLKQATANMPEEADLYYLLAQIYQKLNSKPNYIKYLQTTLSKQVTFSGDIDELKNEIEKAK